MKKSSVIVILILLSVFCYGQKKANSSIHKSTQFPAITGIGKYIIGEFTIQDLHNKINSGEIKYQNLVETKFVTTIEIFDSSLFDENKKAFYLNKKDVTNLISEDDTRIELSFLVDTLYIIDITNLPSTFKEAFLKKYGKGKLKVGQLFPEHPYTICRTCELCPSKKMKNFDSSYNYKNDKISTKLSKTRIYFNGNDDNDWWDCICHESEDIRIENERSWIAFYLKEVLPLQQAKKDSIEKHNKEVNNIYKKL